jgi:RND family efflux transporter MFP subunit
MKHWFLLGLAAGSVAACGPEAASVSELPSNPEPALTVLAETVTTYVPVEGTVVARRRAELSTRMMARVSSVPVELGARVRTGEALIRLGQDDIAASRAKADAAVRVAQAARDEAARHAARMDTLYALDAVAQMQRDQARLGLTQGESQLAMARATLAEVATATGYSTIRAPFDGVVVARAVDPGDMANPGTPLLTLESLGARDAVLAMPGRLAAQVAPGDTIRVVGPGDLNAKAAVRAIAGGADPMTRTVELRATLPADWPTGLTVTGFIPDGVHQALLIPSAAVVRRGQLTGVRVVSDSAAVLRWVRLGRTMPDGRLEVLSGLQSGERIAR